MLGNFRDISDYNINIKKQSIFRSSMIINQEEVNFLRKCNILTIIDLRSKEELSITDYTSFLNKDFSYNHIDFKMNLSNNLYSGSYMESAYKYFALNCKTQFIQILDVIIKSKSPLLFHCKHGMDRTGVVSAFIHLICNTHGYKIINDYMQTGGITKQCHIEIFLENFIHVLNSINKSKIIKARNKLIIPQL